MLRAGRASCRIRTRRPLLPSAVSFQPDGEVLAGRARGSQRASADTIFPSRFMGLGAEHATDEAPPLSFPGGKPGRSRPFPDHPVLSHRRTVTRPKYRLHPPRLNAGSAAREPVSQAVITFPVLHDPSPGTKARRLGGSSPTPRHEPTAAALAYDRQADEGGSSSTTSVADVRHLDPETAAAFPRCSRPRGPRPRRRRLR